MPKICFGPQKILWKVSVSQARYITHISSIRPHLSSVHSHKKSRAPEKDEKYITFHLTSELSRTASSSLGITVSASSPSTDNECSISYSFEHSECFEFITFNKPFAWMQIRTAWMNDDYERAPPHKVQWCQQSKKTSNSILLAKRIFPRYSSRNRKYRNGYNEVNFSTVVIILSWN